MTLTLITVCFNSASVIRTALESVLRQTWPALEYLVVDGGSTDGTVEVLREYEARFAGRMRWTSEPDRGMYDAINKGIRMATGEVVGILNADDVLSKDDVIEKVAGCFESVSGERLTVNSEPLTVNSEPDGDRQRTTTHGLRFTVVPDVIYGDIRFVADRRGVGLDALRAEPTVRDYSARHWRPWMLQWGYMPPHPSVYIRRACFERLGDYALDYKIAADYALLIRFFRRGRLASRYVPMCFVDMRVGGVSTRSWRSNLLLNQEIVRGNREAGYFCCLLMLVPKYAFKIWEFAVPRMRSTLSGSGRKARKRRGS